MEHADFDGFPDGCDNCPNDYNPGQFDVNQNEIGDVCESCCGFWTGGFTGNTDCDYEGTRDLNDILKLIDRVFISKETLCCEANGNVDGDLIGRINLADIFWLIDHIYLSKEETAPCL